MRFSAAIKLLLLVLVGLLLLVAGQSMFKHLRLDLTEDKVFTLSQGTRNIVSQLEQPVELLFFYSEAAMRERADPAQLRPANREYPGGI